MRLTGKAKAKFEEWFNARGYYWGVPCTYSGVKSDPSVEDFYELPELLQ